MTRKQRSGHKKSTSGCAQCKKRHLKCDENRPACVNCTVQGRRCPYQDETPVQLATPTASISSTITTPTPAVRLDIPRSPLELIYVELIQQWLRETHQGFVFTTEHANIYGATSLNYALVCPFLMHGILAFSALHLSFKHSSDKREHYRKQADELQSHGLIEFNKTLTDLNEKSILAAFLFSNVTVAHQMTVCLSQASADSNTFLDLFISCLEIAKGVNAILKGWWPFLMESELKPILATSDRVRAQIDVEQETSEFNGVRQMITSFESTNSNATTETYSKAVSKLQWALNMQRALDSDELNRSMSWAFAWPVNAPSELTQLLKMRRPEAIVILAHYAPLLHFRCSSWVVQDSAAAMFRSLESSLGPNWSKWLQWPREVFLDA